MTTTAAPGRVDGQVRHLPALEHRELAAPAQEARVEPRRPRQVEQQDDVLAERGHTPVPQGAD